MANAARTRVVRRTFFTGLMPGMRTTWPILSALVGLMTGTAPVAAISVHTLQAAIPGPAANAEETLY